MPKEKSCRRFSARSTPAISGVNELNAYVLPSSRLVMRGGTYSANILLAAVDTTQRPKVYIGGVELENNHGLYQVTTSNRRLHLRRIS